MVTQILDKSDSHERFYTREGIFETMRDEGRIELSCDTTMLYAPLDTPEPEQGLDPQRIGWTPHKLVGVCLKVVRYQWVSRTVGFGNFGGTWQPAADRLSVSCAIYLSGGDFTFWLPRANMPDADGLIECSKGGMLREIVAGG